MPVTIHQSGVAACLLDGMDTLEIAAATDLQAHEVRGHIRALCEIYGARNRVHLALLLQRMYVFW